MPEDLVFPKSDQRLEVRNHPASRPVMRQSWRELLFLHWRYDPGELQRLLPEGLTVDTFRGEAWLGVVPFFMCEVRPVWSPAIPGLSNFLELNVRTYVFDQHGNPGVWFFSLDASNPIAVFLARTLFKLPYFNARMRARATPATVDYWSQRGGLEADHFVYQPVGLERLADPDSLDFFLVERYLLFSQNPATNQLYTGRVFHTPYRLREVKVLEYSTHLLSPAKLGIAGKFEHAAYVRNVDVEIFGLRKLMQC